MNEQQRNKVVAQAMFERMLGDVREFRSFSSGCPKCGGAAEHRKVGYCIGAGEDRPKNFVCPIAGEHLHVGCMVCGFEWMEKTKEQEEAPRDA